MKYHLVVIKKRNIDLSLSLANPWLEPLHPPKHKHQVQKFVRMIKTSETSRKMQLYSDICKVSDKTKGLLFEDRPMNWKNATNLVRVSTFHILCHNFKVLKFARR